MCDKTLQNVISCWRGGVRAGGEGQSQGDGWRGAGPSQAGHCHPSGTYTDKKENTIYSSTKKFRWEQLQSHIWGRGFLIYEEMRKCLIIWGGRQSYMTLQLIPSEFPYTCTCIWINFLFFLISVYPNKNMQRSCIINSLSGTPSVILLLSLHYGLADFLPHGFLTINRFRWTYYRLPNKIFG